METYVQVDISSIVGAMYESMERDLRTHPGSDVERRMVEVAFRRLQIPMDRSQICEAVVDSRQVHGSVSLLRDEYETTRPGWKPTPDDWALAKILIEEVTPALRDQLHYDLGNWRRFRLMDLKLWMSPTCKARAKAQLRVFRERSDPHYSSGM